jgi:hypothetical protein
MTGEFTVNWYPIVEEPFPFHAEFVCPPVPGNTAISSAWHIPEAPTNPRMKVMISFFMVSLGPRI